MAKTGKVRFTKSLVERIATGRWPDGAGEYLWAADPAGFGIRRHPSGKTAYLIQGNQSLGERRYRTVRRSLGDLSVMTLDEAMDQARKALADLKSADQRDSIGEAKAARAKPVLIDADVLRAEVAKRYAGKKGEATSLHYLKLGAELLRGRDLRKLDVPTVVKLRAEVERATVPATRKPGEKKRRPASEDQKRQTWLALRNLVDALVLGGELATNPVKQVKGFRPGRSRKRMPALDQLALLHCYLDGTAYGDIIRFLSFLPLRKNEGARARWGWIDLDRRTLTIPPSASKVADEHTLPLSPQAIDILKRRRPSKPQADDLVFPIDSDPTKPFSSWHAGDLRLAKRLAEANVELPHWSPHDIRRTFTTVMANEKAHPIALDMILTHSQSDTKGGVKGVYIRATMWPEQVAAVERFGALLQAAIVKVMAA